MLESNKNMIILASPVFLNIIIGNYGANIKEY